MTPEELGAQWLAEASKIEEQVPLQNAELRGMAKLMKALPRLLVMRLAREVQEGKELSPLSIADTCSNAILEFVENGRSELLKLQSRMATLRDAEQQLAESIAPPPPET